MFTTSELSALSRLLSSYPLPRDDYATLRSSIGKINAELSRRLMSKAGAIRRSLKRVKVKHHARHL